MFILLGFCEKPPSTLLSILQGSRKIERRTVATKLNLGLLLSLRRGADFVSLILEPGVIFQAAVFYIVRQSQ